MKNVFTAALLTTAALFILTAFAAAQVADCDATDYQCKVETNTKRIAANPSDIESVYNRGVAYKNLKKYDQAIADFSNYIASKPANKDYLADGYYNRGFCYRKQGALVNALSDYTMSIQLSPNVSAYVERGNYYVSQDDNAKGIADYNQAIALDVKAVEAYYNRARAYINQKLYAKAIADLDVYITMNQANSVYLSDGYWNRAVAYKGLGKLPEALKDINAAIDLDPTMSGRYSTRADIYRAMGKIALAEADEKKAAELK